MTNITYICNIKCYTVKRSIISKANPTRALCSCKHTRSYKAMSLRPEGYRSDEEYSGDDDEYDFGTDSTRQGKGSAVKPDASSWPANQLSNDTKRHSLRGEKQWRGAGRVGNSRSEGGTPSNATQRPQMRWRSRRTSNSRSHEWKRKSQENFLIAIAQEEVDGEESDQDSKGLTE